MKGPRGPFKGPRGPLKGPRGPFKGVSAPSSAGNRQKNTNKKWPKSQTSSDFGQNHKVSAKSATWPIFGLWPISGRSSVFYGCGPNHKVSAKSATWPIFGLWQISGRSSVFFFNGFGPNHKVSAKFASSAGNWLNFKGSRRQVRPEIGQLKKTREMTFQRTPGSFKGSRGPLK